MRMRLFTGDSVLVVCCHRIRPLSPNSDLLDDGGEGQVPKADQPFAKKNSKLSFPWPPSIDSPNANGGSQAGSVVRGCESTDF
jgi:hypothetical protein